MMRMAARALLAILLLSILAGAALWLARIPLAGVYLERWCRERSLGCSAEITGLGLTHLTARNIEVTSAEGQPAQVGQVELRWHWQGFGMPQIGSVRLDKPEVRAAFDGTDLSFLGLESAVPAPGEDSQPLPAISVRDGRLNIDTPAGALTADIAADLSASGDGGMELEVAPVSLARGADRLVLEAARFRLGLEAGVLSGEGRLSVSEARLGAFAAEAVDGSLAIGDRKGGEGRAITWQADAAQVDLAGAGAEALDLSGTVLAGEIDTLAIGPLLQSLRAAEISVSAERARWGTLSGRTLTADTALSWQDGRLSGPMSVSGEDFAIPVASAAAASFTGELAIEGLARQQLDGLLTLEGAALAPDERSRLAGALGELPGLPAHGPALKAALDEALAGFRLGLQGQVERRLSGTRINLRETTRLVAENGAEIRIDPFNAGPWLTHQSGSTLANGRVWVSGGGLPRLAIDLEQGEFAPGSAALRAGRIALDNWTAGGQSIGAELEQLRLSLGGAAATGSASPRVEASGTVRLAGPFGPAEFAPTTVFGDVVAARSDGDWRVQTGTGDCLGLSSKGLGLAGLRLGGFTTRLCPEGGRISPAGSPAGGDRFGFAAIDAPYTAGDGGGMLRLDGGSLHWQQAGAQSLSLTSPAITIDHADADSDLRLAGTDGRLRLELGDGPLRIETGIGRTTLRGSRLPADLAMAGLDLRLTRTGGRLSGAGTLRALELTAPGSDPVFEPLVSDQALRVSGTTLMLDGLVRLAATGQKVADATLSLALPGLSGTGTITTPALDFRPGGLQPADLSERVRGLLTDASGSARARAEITIDRGRPRVTGEVVLDGLGFQTVALGRVRGVRGAIAFDDLIALSTPPGQDVRIASIDPGVVLEDGEVIFRLAGPETLEIERARWPFAGGQVTVREETWRIGGLDNRLEIGAEGISLSGLVDTFELPDLEATGTVSGRFPLVFSGSDAVIENARLMAAEPGGTLRYTGAAGREAGQVNETAELAFNALRDFRFTVLEIGADGNLSGQIAFTIRLLGHNPDVLYGTPFAFNLNVEAPFVSLVRSGTSFTGTRWLADAVVREGARDEE